MSASSTIRSPGWAARVPRRRWLWAAAALAGLLALARAFAPEPVLVDTALAAPGDAMSIPLASGGSLVLFGDGTERGAFSPTLQRAVLAELTLPLERTRMVALARTLKERASVVGRTTPRHVQVAPEAVYHPALEANP